VLILRRKVGEKIVIGDGIVVVVTRVSGTRVTLGIEAPSSVHIVRGELRPFDDAHGNEPHSNEARSNEPHGGEPQASDRVSLPAPVDLHPAMTVAAPHLPR